MTAAGIFAYYALTIAMRTGQVAAVTPFRYTRLVFAMILGVLVFDEHPDSYTLIGSWVIGDQAAGIGVVIEMLAQIGEIETAFRIGDHIIGPVN